MGYWIIKGGDIYAKAVFLPVPWKLLGGYYIRAPSREESQKKRRRQKKITKGRHKTSKKRCRIGKDSRNSQRRKWPVNSVSFYFPPFFFPTPHEKKKLNDWLARRSQEPTWVWDSNPSSPPCERPSCESAWRNVDRRHYTTCGHHLDPDAILVFRLGYSCGNDQEGPLSAKWG